MDSQSGRFMSVDPQSPVYVNPQSLNQYAYALNNPYRYTDPTGAVSINDTMTTPAQFKALKEEEEEDAIALEKYKERLKALRLYDEWVYTTNPTTTFFQAATTSGTTTQWITTTPTTQITTITTTQQTTITTSVPNTPQPPPTPPVLQPTSTTTVSYGYNGSVSFGTPIPGGYSYTAPRVIGAIEIIMGIAELPENPFFGAVEIWAGLQEFNSS